MSATEKILDALGNLLRINDEIRKHTEEIATLHQMIERRDDRIRELSDRVIYLEAQFAMLFKMAGVDPPAPPRLPGLPSRR